MQVKVTGERQEETRESFKYRVGLLYLWVLHGNFTLGLAESADAKPWNVRGQLYLLNEKSAYKWTRAVQTWVIQGPSVQTKTQIDANQTEILE